MAVVTLTHADNGRSVDAHVGDEIVLLLPENATTGYRWHVERVEGPLEQEADGYQQQADSQQPETEVQFGRGGVREWRFRGVTPGTARLELKHWQAWEGESSVVERFAVDIKLAS